MSDDPTVDDDGRTPTRMPGRVGVGRQGDVDPGGDADLAGRFKGVEVVAGPSGTPRARRITQPGQRNRDVQWLSG